MAFSRALLLKGLAGVATVGAVGGGVVLGGNLFKSNRKVNDKLSSLGLEDDCRLGKDEDSTDFSRECSLDLERLKKIRFSNKGEGELKVVGQVPAELKLKIEGNKEDISFSFKGVSASSPIAIFGDKSKGKIVIKNEEQKFKEKDGKLTKDSGSVDETLKGFNKQLGTVKAPIECRFDEAETDASVECGVTEEDLKGIKFSGLGEGEVKVKGEVSAGLKLKAERDQENVMSLYFTGLGENLTIFADQKGGEEIVIRSDKKFRIGEDGKLEKVTTVVTPELKAKVKEFNGQLGKVNAPLSCRFDEEEGDESVECPVSHEQLKKMEFSNKLGKADLRIVGSVDPNLKLRVERDSENVMSLFFTGLGQDLTIYGYKTEGKIILKSSSETKFKVKEDKLEKESTSSDPTLKTKLRAFNKQLGTINVPNDCRFDDAEGEESLECALTQDKFKELGFSNKGTDNSKIVGWPGSGTIKLRAEKDSNSEMSLSFPDITSGAEMKFYGDKGKINIRSDTKFTVIDNQLTKKTQNKELKRFNNRLFWAYAPLECRFDEAETEESVECSVSKEELKTMKFYGSNLWELSDDKNDLTGMRLKVQIAKTFGKDGNEDGKLLILTFKDYQNTVELKYDAGDEDEKVIAFVKNTNPEFLIDGKDDDNTVLLAKMWDPNDVVDLFDLDCGFEDENTPIECSFTEEGGEINVGKGTGDDFEKLTVTDTNGSYFELYKDQENFNQGYRFVFKGGTVPGREGTGLENDGEYEFKWKVQKGKPRDYYLAKKD